jgi:SAM-dependent methyltransferase
MAVAPLSRAKSTLSIPWVFGLYQWMIGAPACQRRFIEVFSQPRPGDRVIDLGCGTGASVKYLPSGVSYLGVDISQDYVDAARSRFGARGTFLCADLTSTDLTQFPPFDLAISFGVLHHLDDAGAHAMLGLACRIVRPGGRLVTIDPCYVPNQSRIARFLNDHDRGRHIRDADAQRQLFLPHGQVDIVVLSDMLRIPYNMIVATLRIGG